jgi:hypothetical protein
MREEAVSCSQSYERRWMRCLEALSKKEKLRSEESERRFKTGANGSFYLRLSYLFVISIN